MNGCSNAGSGGSGGQGIIVFTYQPTADSGDTGGGDTGGTPVQSRASVIGGSFRIVGTHVVIQ